VIHDLRAGTPVSYGGRWVAPRLSRIATVAVGYADGVPRTVAMTERGEMAIRGRRVPVRGTVCMDFTMVDVTDRADVREGDEAVVFGDDPTAWDVADWAGTNAWQILTSVGLRVPRVYIEDGRVAAVESRY
jgi:alanine racemase